MEYTVEGVRAKIEELRTLGNQFEQNWSRLLSLESAAKLDETAWSNWNALLNRGRSVRDTIVKGVAAIQDASAWIQQVTGVQLSGLGFAPIAIALIVAALVAATVAAGAWINDSNSEIRKLEILQATVAKLPPEQQAKILAEAAGRQPVSWSGNLANIALYIAIAAALVFVMPKLLERK